MKIRTVLLVHTYLNEPGKRLSHLILRDESLVCISSSIELSHKSHAIYIQCAQIIENLYESTHTYVRHAYIRFTVYLNVSH